MGARLFVERVASRLYPHMHQIVQAHQELGLFQAPPVARFLGISNVQCNHFELGEHGCLMGGIVKPQKDQT